jgi:hypothetical protein
MTGKKRTGWPTRLESAIELAGFLRRKMESVGGQLTAFKTATKYLADLLADWQDGYEIAVVYDSAIDANGPTDEIWKLLDLRAYPRLRRQYAPMRGTARYVYLAMFGAQGEDRRELLALVEDLEDALLVEDALKAEAVREVLDEKVRNLPILDATGGLAD